MRLQTPTNTGQTCQKKKLEGYSKIHKNLSSEEAIAVALLKKTEDKIPTILPSCIIGDPLSPGSGNRLWANARICSPHR